MPRTESSVRDRIAERNPWYVDDQIGQQLGSPAIRAVVENRWRVFSCAIEQWFQEGGTDRSGEMSILDAGCGDGINLMGLAHIIGRLGLDATLVGTDYNPLRLTRARAQGARLLNASLLALPFGDESFDVILCSHVLEHIPTETVALQEIRRVLKPTGLLILGVPNEGCVIAQLRNRVFQPEIARTTDHVHFYTSATLIRRMIAAGLDVQSIEREGFFMPHMLISSWLGGRAWGRALLNRLGHWVPSQCAGLIVLAQRR